MIPETTRGTFGAFRDPGPTCPQARCESHVIRAPFSAKERDSGSVYTYDTPPEKSHVMSRGQFSLTSTNVAIPTTLPQRLQGLYGHHMRHLWETMSGSGDSGTGTKPTPCHIHTYPTTSHTLHAQQAPRPRPRLFCPHSPICTQPTGTSRCPAPTRGPDLASAPLMRPNRRPPRPKHPKFTQFHRSGLHFGRTHPQHRQYGDISKAYGDCHSVRGRRSLAGHRKRRTEPHVNNLPHRHGGRRRARMAWLRCPWAAAGPGRTMSRHAERSSQRGRLAGGPPPTGTPSSPAQQAGGPIHINHHDPTGVEGTGGTGGHGRVSRRGTERSEVA